MQHRDRRLEEAAKGMEQEIGRAAALVQKVLAAQGLKRAAAKEDDAMVVGRCSARTILLMQHRSSIGALGFWST